MDKYFKENLIKELKEEKVSKEELGDLLEVAYRLSDLSYIKRSDNFKKAFLRKLNRENSQQRIFLPMSFPFAFALFILLIVGSTSIVYAQRSLPGEILYPLKRLSEKAVVNFKPDYKKEVLKRREEEVKNLTEQKKDPEIVKEAEKEYEEEFKKQDEEIKAQEKDDLNKSQEKTPETKNEDEEEHQQELKNQEEEVNKETENENQDEIKIEDSKDNN